MNTTDSGDELFDIDGDIFTTRQAARYLKDRGVANTVNIIAIMRTSTIFGCDPDTKLVESGFRLWRWQISRRALDAYIVWYRSQETERDRRAYRVMWTEREWAIACDVLNAVGVPVPTRMKRMRDGLYRLDLDDDVDG